MRREQQPDIDFRPWSAGDLPLLQRLMGDPAMTEHLGGPQTPEKISERHERYRRTSDSARGRMFAIVVGPERVAAGSVGYWEREWRGQYVWETGWSVLPEFQGQGSQRGQPPPWWSGRAQRGSIGSFMPFRRLTMARRMPSVRSRS